MLLHSGLCEVYVKCLKKLRGFVGNNVEWIPEKNRFQLYTAPFKRTIIISTFFFCTQNAYFLTLPESEKRSINDFWVVFAAMFAFVVTYAFEMIRNKDVVEQMITGLSSFEQRYCANGKGLQKEDIRRMKSASRICSIMSSIGFGPCGLALGLIAILLPNTVLNVLSYPPGSWIISSLDLALRWIGLPAPLVWLFVKSVVVLVNLYVFTVNYGSGVNLCNQIVTGCLSLIVALRLFDRRVQAQASQVQVASVERNSEQKIYRSCVVYREIQLLVLSFNIAHSYVLVSLVLTAIVAQVVSVVGLLQKHDDASIGVTTLMFLQLFYVEGDILCVVCINFIFGYCADVYVESAKCISNLRYSKTIRMSKHLKRVIWSMPVVKVTFGRTNYIDRLSPVNFQQFTNEKIVDTLLLAQ